jgi:WD40 repeat protein
MELKGHSNMVRSLDFSPDSARIVSGSDDMAAMVWSTTTGERLANLTGHTGPVSSVRYSPNGNQIASCAWDSDIRIWQSHSGELVRVIQVATNSLAWTPNGQHLIAACLDGFINFFDPSTGSQLAGWNGDVRSITVSPNGKFIASASFSGTAVRLWNTTTHQQIGPTLQHDAAVLSVAISPDGSHLVSGGYNKKVWFWSLKDVVAPLLLENTPTTSNIAVRAHVYTYCTIFCQLIELLQVNDADVDLQLSDVCARRSTGT